MSASADSEPVSVEVWIETRLEDELDELASPSATEAEESEHLLDEIPSWEAIEASGAELKAGKVYRLRDAIWIKEIDHRRYLERLDFLRSNSRIAPAVIYADPQTHIIEEEDLERSGFQTYTVKTLVGASKDRKAAFGVGLLRMFNKMIYRYSDMTVRENYAWKEHADGTIEFKMFEAGARVTETTGFGLYTEFAGTLKMPARVPKV